MYYLVSLEIASEVSALDTFLLAGEIDADRLAVEVNARVAQVAAAGDLSVSVTPIDLMPLRPGHTVAQAVNARLLPVAEHFGAEIRQVQRESVTRAIAEDDFPNSPF